MCGIYGFTRKGFDQSSSQAYLDQMSELLQHRGPDGQGGYIDDVLALGHRRLSIIDLDSGAQPMQDWLQRFVVTFNGEIYNFQSLRRLFESEGFRFRTKSDTEVILAAYAKYGEDCVNHFQGMFAFAIWDKQEQKLLLARDRLGKKPLYYSFAGDRFVFASELKAILALPGMSRELDLAALHFYLTFGYIPAPMTIFKRMRKVGEASLLTYQHNTVNERRYWQAPEFESGPPVGEGEAVDQLEAMLTDAVKSRLISDVPLGAFLSGGVDSSAVVAMMARLSKVKTFTIDFAEKSHSEVADAAAVSALCGTEHTVLQVATEAMSVLPKIAWHFDEPFADSSAIPTYYVSKMAREHVTVILSGDGGDELFAGYNSYANREQYKMLMGIPRAVRAPLFGALAGVLPVQAPMRNLFKYAALAEAEEGPGALGLYPYIKEDIISRQIAEDFRKNNPVLVRRELLSQHKEQGQLSRLQLADLTYYLPSDILVKVDRMSMANSLETRAPLLDYRLVEFAAQLPVSLKMNNGQGKFVLKKVLKRLAPGYNLQKQKQGFAAPIESWFKTALSGYTKGILLDERSTGRGIFKPRMIAKILALHEQGRRDYSEWIYMLLMLELWFQTFVDIPTRRI